MFKFKCRQFSLRFCSSLRLFLQTKRMRPMTVVGFYLRLKFIYCGLRINAFKLYLIDHTKMHLSFVICHCVMVVGRGW